MGFCLTYIEDTLTFMLTSSFVAFYHLLGLLFMVGNASLDSGAFSFYNNDVVRELAALSARKA